MDYFESPVPDQLRRYLQCIWHLIDHDPSDQIQTIYPDGRCELIVHLGTPMSLLLPDGSLEQQAHCLFAGQQTQAVRLQAQSTINCIGIRLNPAASLLAVGHEAHRYVDQIVDLACLNPEFATALTKAARSFSETKDMTTLAEVLLNQFQSQQIDQRMEISVQAIDKSLGMCTIKPLAAQAAMSLRNFQYQFQKAVGFSAKNYARVIRLQATLRLLDQTDPEIVNLAETMGFSDQAHVTRELKRITGLTPSRLRNALGKNRNDASTIQLAAAFVRGKS